MTASEQDLKYSYTVTIQDKKITIQENSYHTRKFRNISIINSLACRIELLFTYSRIARDSLRSKKRHRV